MLEIIYCQTICFVIFFNVFAEGLKGETSRATPLPALPGPQGPHGLPGPPGVPGKYSTKSVKELKSEIG